MRATHLIAAAAILAHAGCGKKTENEKASGGVKLDACALVTQDDATALFGQPASPYQASIGPSGPKGPGDCEWQYVYPDNSSQLLQLHIYGSPVGYSEVPGAQPFAIGDKGYVAVSELTGVDIEWVQKGQLVQLSLFSTGPAAAKATAKVEQVKELARKVEATL